MALGDPVVGRQTMATRASHIRVGLALLLSTSLGCGTRGYEERLEKTVTRLSQESAFADMYPPTTLPDTQITVRLPRNLAESPLPEGTPSLYYGNSRVLVHGFLCFPNSAGTQA